MNPRRRIVEAGAGCGKTFGLVQFYLQSLEKLNPNEIVVLTFTEDAANEMLHRTCLFLDEKGWSDKKQEVLTQGYIGTFHSYCLRLVSEKLIALGYPSQIAPSHVARAERASFIIKRLSEWSQKSDLLAIQDLRTLVSQGLDLWFSDISYDAIQIQKLVEDLKNKQETWLNAFRSEALVAYKEAPEKERNKSWLKSLVENIENNEIEKIKDIKLTYSKVLSQTFPDLLEKTKSLKEFFKNNLHLSLLNLETELNDQKSLLEFYSKLHTRGPKILDFEAMEKELLFLVRDETFLDTLPSPKLFIVDEFQDTSPTQYELLTLLSKKSKSDWYFVGDPKQSIYRFRGADTKLFSKLKNELELVNYDSNYRSHPDLLDFFNDFQNHLFKNPDLDPSPQHLKPTDKTLTLPTQKEIPHLKIKSHHRVKPEIFESIIFDYKTSLRMLPGRSHCAIFHTWKHIFDFVDYLKKENIAYFLGAPPPLLNHHLSHLFLTFVEGIILQKNELIHSLEEFWSFRRLLPDEIENLKDLDFISLLYVFVKNIDPARWLDGRLWMAAMERFLKSHAGVKHVRGLSAFQILSLLREEIENVEVRLPQLPTIKIAAKDTLILMTAHGSKGLQFDCVYYPDLDSKRSFGPGLEQQESLGANLNRIVDGKKVPSLLYLVNKRRHDQALSSEKARLAYVATTRAVSHLNIYLGSPKEKDNKADPLSIFGIKDLEPFSLSTAVYSLLSATDSKKLMEKGTFYWDKSLEKTKEDPQPECQTEKTKVQNSEKWNLPFNKTGPEIPVREFFRGGVSRYLAKGETHNEKTLDLTSDSALPSNTHADLDGTRFHKIMELWDGTESSLQVLKEKIPISARVDLILGALRTEPALEGYWRDLTENPERVLKEFGLFLYNDTYRLSGFADLLWIKSPHEICIVDWKSTYTQGDFGSERLDKITKQLSLYASGFNKNFKVHLLAIKINLNTSTDTLYEILGEW